MAWRESVTPQCEGRDGELVHSHQNLNILRKLDGNGDGSKFMSNDGTFKEVAVSGVLGGYLDGGRANSVYTVDDIIDGGSAGSFS